jgi:hypothetical protein
MNLSLEDKASIISKLLKEHEELLISLASTVTEKEKEELKQVKFIECNAYEDEKCIYITLLVDDVQTIVRLEF